MAWMLFSSPDAGELADEELMNIYEAPTRRMLSDNSALTDSNWDNAITAYKEGQFSVAVAAIESSIGEVFREIR